MPTLLWDGTRTAQQPQPLRRNSFDTFFFSCPARLLSAKNFSTRPGQASQGMPLGEARWAGVQTIWKQCVYLANLLQLDHGWLTIYVSTLRLCSYGRSVRLTRVRAQKMLMGCVSRRVYKFQNTYAHCESRLSTFAAYEKRFSVQNQISILLKCLHVCSSSERGDPIRDQQRQGSIFRASCPRLQQGRASKQPNWRGSKTVSERGRTLWGAPLHFAQWRIVHHASHERCGGRRTLIICTSLFPAPNTDCM